MKKKALKVSKAKTKKQKTCLQSQYFTFRHSHTYYVEKTYLSQWTVIEFNVDSVNNKLLVVIISISLLIKP